jgi:mevalonate kinase
MGSGAAVSVAVIRAISLYIDRPLSTDAVSRLAFEGEKLHHGTPSGIDNAVVALERPVFFTRGHPIELLPVNRPFRLAIADTGVSSPTKIAVGDVRSRWNADRMRVDALFDEIGAIVLEARRKMEAGEIELIGDLMNANQSILRNLGVSSPEIERLVTAALKAGARGAKLSGAGRGGNVIAAVEERSEERIERALLDAGAKCVFMTGVA